MDLLDEALMCVYVENKKGQEVVGPPFLICGKPQNEKFLIIHEQPKR
jgi:hypothetical protein